MLPLLCYVFGRNTSSYCCSLFPNTCILYLDINLLYELFVCAVFYPTELFISALLLSIMRKAYKPNHQKGGSLTSEHGKHWMPAVTNAFCRNCRCSALLKKKFLVSAEKLGFCWLIPVLSPVPCKHGRYFLEKCRIGRYSLYSLMVCFLRCVLCPFYPCYKKNLIEWLSLGGGRFG